ncbi:MAG: hypothetical protein HYT27_00110 [Parcubacteria group bacterium]|nr:hypothetical protein [Parcubacteria group bacterium]
MEKEPKNESAQNPLDRKEIRDFIKKRNIRLEDLSLIEALASFPQEMIIMGLHNTFNMHQGRSGEELEFYIQTTKDTDKKKLYEAALNFYNKYGWSTSFSLVRTLEGEI